MDPPQAWKYLGYFVNAAYFFKVFPVPWDSKLQRISTKPVRLRDFFLCYLNAGILFGYSVFDTIQLIRLGRKGEITIQESVATTMAKLIVACLIHGVLIIGHQNVLPDIASFTFQYTRFFMKCEGKPIKGKEYLQLSPAWLHLLIFAGLTGPIFGVFQYIEFCRQPIFITYYLPKQTPENQIVIYSSFFFTGILHVWDFCVIVTSFGFIAIQMLYYFLMSRCFLCKLGAGLACEAPLSRPAWKLLEYRCLQILTNKLNFLIRDILYILVNMSLAILVCFVFAVVRFHSDFSVYLVVDNCIGMILFVWALVQLYTVFAKYHSVSLQYINAMRRAKLQSKADFQLWSRYVKSFRPLKIQYSDYGYFHKERKAEIIGKMIFFSAKALVILKP